MRISEPQRGKPALQKDRLGISDQAISEKARILILQSEFQLKHATKNSGPSDVLSELVLKRKEKMLQPQLPAFSAEN